MKTVKFRDYLVPFVLSGEKNSTWRLFDDKDLNVGDDIELQVLVTNNPFAIAKITEIVEKPFKELTDDDKAGHETFDNDDMYSTYSKYYKTKVGPETNVKIIRFELVNK
jgi:hypothetical protein